MKHHTANEYNKLAQFALVGICAAVLSACSSNGSLFPNTTPSSSTAPMPTPQNPTEAHNALKQAAQMLTAAQTAQQQVARASTEATAAKAEADKAQAAGNKKAAADKAAVAKQKAENAKAEADKAQAAADKAVAAAQAAKDKADQAVAAANTDASKAEAAKLQQDAATQLNTAKQLLQAARQQVSNSATQLSAAQQLADATQAALNNNPSTPPAPNQAAFNAAKAEAQTALNQAAQAQTGANTAKQAAQQAANQAAAAKTEAENAKAAGNKKAAADKAAVAKQKAENAKAEADKAQTAADQAVAAAQAAKDKADKAAAAANTDAGKTEAAKLQRDAAAQLTAANQALQAARQQVSNSVTQLSAAQQLADATQAALNNNPATPPAPNQAAFNAAKAEAQTALNQAAQAQTGANTAKQTAQQAANQAAAAKTEADKAQAAATDTAGKKNAADKAALAKQKADAAKAEADKAQAAADKAVAAAQAAKDKADKAAAAANTDASKAEAAKLQQDAAAQLTAANQALQAARQQVQSLTAAVAAAAKAAADTAKAYADAQKADSSQPTSPDTAKSIADKLAELAKPSTEETFATFSKAEIDADALKAFRSEPDFAHYSPRDARIWKASHYSRLRPFNDSSVWTDIETQGKVELWLPSKPFYANNENIGALSPNNLIGVEIYNSSGEIYKHGTHPRALDRVSSPFELSTFAGKSRYHLLLNHFDTSADNHEELNKGRRLPTAITHETDSNGQSQWKVTAKPNTDYHYFYDSSLGRYYMSRNGEYAYQFNIQEDNTPIDLKYKTDVWQKANIDNSLVTRNAAGLPTAFKKKGTYMLVMENNANNTFRIEPYDPSQFLYTAKVRAFGNTYNEILLRGSIASDKLPEEGAFENKRLVADVFASANVGKTSETRGVYSYDVGKSNGYNQAYLSLHTWKYKKHDGSYDETQPYNIGVFSKLPKLSTPERMIDLQDPKTGKLLEATYKGPAYSHRDGKQDGVFSLHAKFSKYEDYNNNPNIEVIVNGTITNRRLDDGRDIHFASGFESSIRTPSGMPSATAGKAVSFEKGNGERDAQFPITAWMKGKHDNEEKVIYGSGRGMFAGPRAEEVGGRIKIETKDGVNDIGFIGKR